MIGLNVPSRRVLVLMGHHAGKLQLPLCFSIDVEDLTKDREIHPERLKV